MSRKICATHSMKHLTLYDGNQLFACIKPIAVLTGAKDILIYEFLHRFKIGSIPEEKSYS